ncbi:hypothetical protein [Roseofilum sp. Guam]|uniref:hypothetical protein n=1 Tax=Roseofilum sp. Guam TaxID=2821502 RepID=UPI001B2E8AFD|nr:hypothetical protein [Roseofilum sp. Guam]MBP0030917.1 hypothetical protein [Roseofilum sp. Guam]
MSLIKTQYPTTQVPKVTEDAIFPSGEIQSDEPELESYRHLAQLMLLLNSLEWHWQSRQDFFAAGNLSIYYTPPAQNAPRDRGPGFFVAMNTEGKPRKSWVVWQEGGKYPDAMGIAFVGLVIIVILIKIDTPRFIYNNGICRGERPFAPTTMSHP